MHFRLYFFKQLGCPACAAAEPLAQRFKAAHPEGLLIPILASSGRKIAGFRAKVTPSYLIVLGKDKRGISSEGPMDVDDLEAMLTEARGEGEDDGESDDGADGGEYAEEGEGEQEDEPEEDEPDEDE